MLQSDEMAIQSQITSRFILRTCAVRGLTRGDLLTTVLCRFGLSGGTSLFAVPCVGTMKSLGQTFDGGLRAVVAFFTDSGFAREVLLGNPVRCD